MSDTPDLAQKLAEAEATIAALLAGQIDAVLDVRTKTPLLLFEAQAALRESEARYRRIVETANEGILTIDRHSMITFVNQRAVDILGHSAKAMLGTSLFRYVTEAAKVLAALRVERAYQGLSEESEVCFHRPDGSEVWVLLKTSLIQDLNGKNLGTLVMMTDRKAERHDVEALRKSEEQLRQIIEMAPHGIIKIDDVDLLIFTNSRFAEMLGYEPRELMGKNVFDLMSEDAKAIAAPLFEDRLRVLKDAVDSSFRHKDGSEVSVNIASGAIVDAEGRRVATLAMVRSGPRARF